MNSIERYCEETLSRLHNENAFRTFKNVAFPTATHIEIAGRRLVNASSNNYLSLSHHPVLLACAKDALFRYGTGGTSSRYVAGNVRLYDELECALAEWKGFERGLVFSSGYTANLGLLRALITKDDIVIFDRLSHASIIDGIRLSGAPFKRFPHRGYDALADLLCEHRARYRNAFIVTESVFSMDGDVSDLARLIAIKEKYDAALIVDEAHGTGVFGETGSGVIEEQNAKGVDIEVGTLSKAIPALGGYVLASAPLIDVIRNYARSLIYTTALPPQTLAVAREAVRLIPALRDERKAYRARLAAFRTRINERGYYTFGSESQILPIRTGSNTRTLAMADALRERGIFATGIRPPTVPKGEGRVRVSLCMGHTEEEVASLFNAIVETLPCEE